MRAFKLLVLSTPMVLLLACSGELPPAPPAMTPIEADRPDRLKGEVFYLDRRALSDQAELIVELGLSGEPGPIAQPLALPLNGQQVPIAFELPLSQAFDRSIPVRLRAAILEPDGTTRIGSSAEIMLSDTQDIGELRLGFLSEEDYQAAYRCGDTEVKVLNIGERLILAIGEQRQILSAVPAASGARYRNEELEFWTHQGQARLNIDGQEGTECQLMPAQRDSGDELIGQVWKITEIAGTEPVPDSRPEIEFLQDESRMSGTAGCNRFGGQFLLGDQSLSFGPLMSTLMACPNEALSDQERRTLEALASVERFEIVPGPELRLFGGGRLLIRAGTSLD